MTSLKALGYTDELIAHIKAHNTIYRLAGMSGESCDYVHTPPEWIELTNPMPRFALPPLGQYYRPLTDLVANLNGNLFVMYAEENELDVLPSPPHKENFILEFSGAVNPELGVQCNDLQLWGAFQQSKYVIQCTQLEAKATGDVGYGIMPFYYFEKDTRIFPKGWSTLQLPFVVWSKMERIKNADGPGFELPIRTYISPLVTEKQYEAILAGLIRMMWIELRAFLQFLVISKRH